MKATVSDIMMAMENVAPEKLAENWDNPGLQIGHPKWIVNRVWVALDPTLEVIREAVKKQVDMVVTHHPLIFSPITSLVLNTPVGEIFQTAVSKKLAVFSAHTNLDVVPKGVNDTLALSLGLKNILWLDGQPGDIAQIGLRHPFGFGRLGELDKEMNLQDLASMVKAKLGLNHVKVCGSPELKINRVATCCGSGSGLMEAFFSSRAQVLISGDLKYHNAQDARALGLGLVDIGHFASEHLVLETLSQELHKELEKNNFDVIVEMCDLEKDPFDYY